MRHHGIVEGQGAELNGFMTSLTVSFKRLAESEKNRDHRPFVKVESTIMHGDSKKYAPSFSIPKSPRVQNFEPTRSYIL